MIAAPHHIWALRINLYNNSREMCANLNSLGRRTSSIKCADT
jgi:hypothetical protein